MEEHKLVIKKGKGAGNSYIVPSVVGGFIFSTIAAVAVFVYIPSMDKADATEDRSTELVVEEQELKVEVERKESKSDPEESLLDQKTIVETGNSMSEPVVAYQEEVPVVESEVPASQQAQDTAQVKEDEDSAVLLAQGQSVKPNTPPTVPASQSFTLDVNSNQISLSYGISASDADGDELKYDYSLFRNGTQVSINSVGAINREKLIGYNQLDFSATSADFGNTYLLKVAVTDSVDTVVQDITINVTAPVIAASITSPVAGQQINSGQMIEFRSSSSFISDISNGQVKRTSLMNSTLGKSCAGTPGCGNWQFGDFEWVIRDVHGTVVSGPQLGTTVSATLSEQGSYTAEFRIYEPESGTYKVTKSVQFEVVELDQE